MSCSVSSFLILLISGMAGSHIILLISGMAGSHVILLISGLAGSHVILLISGMAGSHGGFSTGKKEWRQKAQEVTKMRDIPIR